MAERAANYLECHYLIISMMPMCFGKTPSLIADALCPLTSYITAFPGSPHDAAFLFSGLHKINK